jgi:hypothetical protein
MSPEDDDWDEVERRVVRLLVNGEFANALNELETFLATSPPPASARAALSYRAMTKEDIGNLPGAVEDLLRAHALSEPGTYNRYTLESSLGSLSAVIDRPDEAVSWLRAALHTVLECRDVSGGSALRMFLGLRREDSLSPIERALCTEVAYQSWKVLRQPGEPDLTNLTDAADLLVELGSRPLPDSAK